MIIIDVSIGIDGIPSEKTILLGNKYENNDTIVNFDLPADFNTYKKYIITVNRNTTRIFPLTDDRLVVSSALTELAGNWAMYLMCRESTIDLSVDNPDISAKENEHVFISDGFIGTVADIRIDRRLVESIPMDTNLKIAYDDLMDLKAELLARIAGIDEYYTKTDTNTNDIAQNSDMIQRIKTNMESKVDKVEGKGLSTEDYTTEEKSKLAGLSNYDDTTVKQDISNLKNNKVDKVEGKGLSTNDFTNEEKDKLSSLSNYDDSQIKSDIGDLNVKISQETTNRTNADNALQEKINTNKNDISELKGDLANKLPKSPAGWEPWTADEQAAARDRIGINEYDLIDDITIAEDVELFSYNDINLNRILVDITVSQIPDEGITAQMYVKAPESKLFYIGRIAKVSNLNKVLFMATCYNGVIVVNAATGENSTNANRVLQTSMPVLGDKINGIMTAFALPAKSTVRIYGVRA